MPDYIPKSDADLVVWYNNFNAKFPIYALGVGFVAGDIIAVQNEFNTLNWMVNVVEVFKAESKERVQYKDIILSKPVGTPTPIVPTIPTITPPATIVVPGILARTRAIVNRIKAAPSYTPAMGQDLGIIGTAPPPPPPATAKPVLSLELDGGKVLIKFNKGTFDGVVIETQRGAETAWMQLDKALNSPYQDTRPVASPGVAEARRYRAMYLKKNASVGQWSATSTILVA